MKADEDELRELRRAKFRAETLELLGFPDPATLPFPNDPHGRRKRLDLEKGVGRHANSYVQKRRNELIVELAAEEGWTQWRIADYVGLSQSTVNDVLRKNKAA